MSDDPMICPTCGHLYAECYHDVNAPEEDALISVESQLSALQVEFAQLTATKDGAYHERNQVVAFLSKLFPASLERHTGNQDWDPDWLWVVMIDLPGFQVSWHIKSDELDLFSHLPREAGRVWDGHTTEQKYARMAEMPLLTNITPVMAAHEWGSLSAQARHNLNVWAMNANRTSEELERAQDKLDRILDVCKKSFNPYVSMIERIITGQSTDPIDINHAVEVNNGGVNG